MVAASRSFLYNSTPIVRCTVRREPISDVKRKALVIGGVALEKKASDVVILHTEPLTSIADYFVLCSGNSERQVKALADAIRREMVRRFGDHGTVEGETAAKWILLDYGDIIVHVFQEDIRAYYGLENMWRDAPQIPQTEYDALGIGHRSSQQPESIPKSINVIHQAG